MVQSDSIFSVSFSQVTVTVACMVCLLLPVTAANLQIDDPTFERIDKRDVSTTGQNGLGGIKLHCQAHPRNCPGGYLLKRNTLIDSLLKQDAGLQATGEKEELFREQALLTAGEELKRSLHSLRTGLKQRLVEILRPSFTHSAQDSKEEW